MLIILIYSLLNAYDQKKTEYVNTKLWLISFTLHMESIAKTYHFFLQNVSYNYTCIFYHLCGL